MDMHFVPVAKWNNMEVRCHTLVLLSLMASAFLSMQIVQVHYRTNSDMLVFKGHSLPPAYGSPPVTD